MFYQKNIEEIFYDFQCTKNGLSHDEATKRRKQFGDNVLLETKTDSQFVLFIKHFHILFLFILLIAGLSYSIESLLVIMCILFLRALLITLQCIKEKKSLETLKKLSVTWMKVLRDNKLIKINSSKLTLGDIVFIEAGDLVSGDGRLIECSSLKVNESALTKEMESVDKTSDTINEDVSLKSRKNMVYSGSLVTSGHGQYIVCNIGMNTEIAKSTSIIDWVHKRKTPLQNYIDNLSEKISMIIMMICLIVLIFNLFIIKETLIHSLMISASLAVAATTKELSSIISFILSLSSLKMAKENAIIKDIRSIEKLGCVSVICCDKTGTLTQNKITVQSLYFYNEIINIKDLNKYYDHHYMLLKSCLICNNASINNNQRIGDQSELALLDLVDEYKNITQHYISIPDKRLIRPFDSKRKLMSVASSHHLYIKGPPDILIERCQYILINEKKERLTNMHKIAIHHTNQEYAKNGLHVLSFAYKDYYEDEIKEEHESQFTFIALVSLQDPTRPESKEAIEKCRLAGMKPIMMSRDCEITSVNIAKEINIFKEGDMTMDGQELSSISDEEFHKKIPFISVYFKVSDEHKIRIVKCWQNRGEIIAMSGNGIHDAPALKQSDMGVGMGISGTEVSKNAADMILTDDSFSTIVRAVITGRNVYRNTKNVINYLLSSHFAGILCFFCAILLMLPAPFHLVHLLFMNMITDFLPAIAIGMEKVTDDIVKEKPRKSNDLILNKTALCHIGFEGLVIASCTMCAYLLGLRQNAYIASTMAFAVIALSRLFHSFNCRSHLPLLKIGLFSNIMSIYAFIIGFILLHLVLFVPFLQSLFMIETINFIQLLYIYLFSSFPTVIIQPKKT